MEVLGRISPGGDRSRVSHRLRHALPWIAVVTIAWLTGLQGCQIVDPLLGEYTVRSEEGVPISVKFRGGEGVSRVRQRDIIQDFLLDLSGDVNRESAVFDAMLELEALFESNGYPLVAVEHRMQVQSGRAQVEFDIVQGPLVIVKELSFSGNTALDSETLTGYWGRRRTAAFGFGEDLYVVAELVSLTGSILAHYRRLGYMDVAVLLSDPDPLLSPTTETVQVSIKITEGPRYSVSRIDTEPQVEEVLDADAPVPPQVGSPFISAQVQDYSLSLGNYLRRRGYADPEILVSTALDPENHTVSLRVHGDAGPIVTVESIEVRGNSFVSTSQILERISLGIDELFDGADEEESLMRLYQSGLFRRVEVLHEPTGDGRIAVVFEVEETTRYLVQPMVGYGSYEEIRGGLEFEMLSVLGSGFDFNAKGIASEKGHRVSATLSDSQFLPRLFGYDTTFSISADTFRREEPSYTDGAVGLTPSLAHNFTRALSGRVGYIFREHNNTSSTVIDPGALIGDYTEGSVVLEMTYDDRDNPLRPTEGTRVALQLKRLDESLGGDVTFDRIGLSASTILPITEATRLVLRAEAGWLTPGEGSDAVPIQERYFNGGESSVRSFREDKLAPDELLDVNGQVVGGEFRTVFNAEFRWAPPLQPLRAMELEMALFGDAGNLGKSVESYGLQDMKYGVGAGLRFVLPIGPVRFDIAHNPDRLLRERDWTLHFSIGYPF